MTSNQIAAEANAIRRDELEETKRHNLETEFISQDKNQIERNYNAVMADLKGQELSLKKELESLKLEITKSQGDRKNEIQAEYNDVMSQLNMIHKQMADTDEMYKTSMAGNAALVTGETKRSNLANEEIRRKTNTIKEHEVDIVERNEEGLTKKGRSQILVNETKAYQQMGDPRAVSGKIYIKAGELGEAISNSTYEDRQTRSHIKSNTKNSSTGGGSW